MPLKCNMQAQSLSSVQLFVTCNSLSPARLLSPGKNTGVGCHFLLQGIFLTQGWNPWLLQLLHWQVDSLPPGGPQMQYKQKQMNVTACQMANIINYGGNGRAGAWHRTYIQIQKYANVYISQPCSPRPLEAITT